jgi:hypothetical protein
LENWRFEGVCVVGGLPGIVQLSMAGFTSLRASIRTRFLVEWAGVWGGLSRLGITEQASNHRAQAEKERKSNPNFSRLIGNASFYHLLLQGAG